MPAAPGSGPAHASASVESAPEAPHLIPAESDPPNRRRAVLLGASNLTRGLPAAVAAARAALGSGPVEVLAAAGHGRSFGAASRAGPRGLPGILDCGLWAALAAPAAGGAGAAAPALALITDPGNDLGYGFPPATVAGWIEECVDRLAARGFSPVLTAVPLATLRALPAWRFRLAAAVLFPTRRLERQQVLRDAEELQDRLAALAARRRLRLVTLDPALYGADAIHVRRRRLAAAWAAALGTAEPAPRPPVADALRLRLALPEIFTLAGAPLGRAQPAVRLGDGSRVSLY